MLWPCFDHGPCKVVISSPDPSKIISKQKKECKWAASFSQTKISKCSGFVVCKSLSPCETESAFRSESELRAWCGMALSSGLASPSPVQIQQITGMQICEIYFGMNQISIYIYISITYSRITLKLLWNPSTLWLQKAPNIHPSLDQV